MARLLGLLLCMLILSAGCGPAVPEEELGTVLEEAPEVPGSQKPYELPEVDLPDPEAGGLDAPQQPDRPGSEAGGSSAGLGPIGGPGRTA